MLKTEHLGNNPSRKLGTGRGFTILEIIIVISILSIFTAAAIPMVGNSVKRQREIELREALRQIRDAIDRYKKDVDRTGGVTIPIEFKTQTGYPKNLEILYEGFVPANIPMSTNKIKYLRKIPIDPMTGRADWKLKSFKGTGDLSSGGDDVYDISSVSDGQALNGSYYRDW